MAKLFCPLFNFCFPSISFPEWSDLVGFVWNLATDFLLVPLESFRKEVFTTHKIFFLILELKKRSNQKFNHWIEKVLILKIPHSKLTQSGLLDRENHWEEISYFTTKMGTNFSRASRTLQNWTVKNWKILKNFNMSLNESKTRRRNTKFGGTKLSQIHKLQKVRDPNFKVSYQIFSPNKGVSSR